MFLFAWYAFGAFLRKPKVLFRLLRAFTYSNESRKDEAYVELSSIGILPIAKKRGIGSAMIKYLVSILNGAEFEYIKLETDKDNNEVANCFYKKNGFVLSRSYETPEGRRMNEYRLDLRRNE